MTESEISYPLSKLNRIDETNINTFVSFDFECTGTYGSKYNDGPSEICEIGAVKIKNGEIIAKFSKLVNPRRLMTKTVTTLTGITDRDLASQEYIEDVLSDFQLFCKNYVLLGHGIHSSDIPILRRTSDKWNIPFRNQYYDTVYLAKKMQQVKKYDNIKLGYLSEYYQVSNPEAHRACNDANTTALLFMKMRTDVNHCHAVG